MPQLSAEEVFNLCGIVSPLEFFRQLGAEATASLCASLVVRPLKAGAQLVLAEDARVNPLYVVLEGALLQGPWTLRPGDTAGFRNFSRTTTGTQSECTATEHRRLTAGGGGDTVVAIVEPERADAILRLETPAWTPVLSRSLLRRKKDDDRSESDVAAILDLLTRCNFIRTQPRALQHALATLMRLHDVEPGEEFEVGQDEMAVVLSGSMRGEIDPVQISDDGEKYESEEDVSWSGEDFIGGVVELTAGLAYPPNAIEDALKKRAANGTAKKRKAFSRGCIIFEAQSCTQVLTVNVDEVIRTAYPAVDIEYSAESCRSTLRKHRLHRTRDETNAFAANVLARLPFFAQLPQACIENLAADATLLRLKTGALATVDCAVLLTGGATLVTSSPHRPQLTQEQDETDEGQQEEEKTQALSPGDVVGRFRILHCGDAVTVRADEPTELAVLSKADFDRWAQTGGDETGETGPCLQRVFPEVPACLIERLSSMAEVRRVDACTELGAFGRLHYLIIKGSVSVHWDSQSPQPSSDPQQKSTQDNTSRLLSKLRRWYSNGTRADDFECRKIWRKINLGPCQLVLGPDQIVGESLGYVPSKYGLEVSNITARVVTREDCVLLSVDRSKLVELFASLKKGPLLKNSPAALAYRLLSRVTVEKQQQHEKTSMEEDAAALFATDSLLKDLPATVKIRLAKLATVRHLKKGAPLGDPAESVFVLDGIFEVSSSRRTSQSVFGWAKRNLVKDGVVVGHMFAGDSVPGRHVPPVARACGWSHHNHPCVRPSFFSPPRNKVTFSCDEPLLRKLDEVATKAFRLDAASAAAASALAAARQDTGFNVQDTSTVVCCSDAATVFVVDAEAVVRATCGAAVFAQLEATRVSRALSPPSTAAAAAAEQDEEEEEYPPWFDEMPPLPTRNAGCRGEKKKTTTRDVDDDFDFDDDDPVDTSLETPWPCKVASLHKATRFKVNAPKLLIRDFVRDGLLERKPKRSSNYPPPVLASASPSFLDYSFDRTTTRTTFDASTRRTPETSSYASTLLQSGPRSVATCRRVPKTPVHVLRARRTADDTSPRSFRPGRTGPVPRPPTTQPRTVPICRAHRIARPGSDAA